MASLNKVMIIGNLGRDPEVSYTPGGLAVAKVNLATTDIWNDKATGEKRERTEWHRVVFFGKQAETIGRYMSKGRQMYVEGRLQTSSYEKDGITRYSTDIIANNFQFLGQKGDGGGFQGNAQGGYPQGNGFQQGGGNGFPNTGGGFSKGGGNGFQNTGGSFSQNSGSGFKNTGGGFQQPATNPQGDGRPQQQPQSDFDTPYDSEPSFTPPPDDEIPF